MLKERHIYKVSELTQDIKLILESTFPEIWVEGEVSNFKKHSSGHIYLTLKDANSQIKCCFFRGNNFNLKFEMKDGMQVLAFGRVGVYERDGAYQLYIQKVEPKGVGALALAFEQLKKKLEKEGLFAAEHKKPIPFLPRKIGIVTSRTGAAIRDILNILERRFADTEIIISPVKVQGEGAAAEIAKAIENFNSLNGRSFLGDIEVLIVTRGGGSLEDLWAFNEEIVARAIYNSKIPVISAVGHEVDFTIADFVADLRAPTPSAAAELVLPKKEDLKEKLSYFASRLNNYMMEEFDSRAQNLNNLLSSYAFRAPIENIEQLIQSVDNLNSNLNTNFSHLFNNQEVLAQNLISRLETLSPLSILSRGYSVALKLPKEEVIFEANQVNANDLVKIRLNKGNLVTKVIEINN